MFKNRNIICISTIDWDFIWQIHHEVVSGFLKNGNRVLFIENTGVRVPGIRDISRIKSRIKNWLLGVGGIREEKKGLFIYSPLILPFPYLRFARWINRHLILSVLQRWFRIMGFNDTVSFVFLPTPLSLELVENLNSEVVVYYCVDNFSASSTAAKKIRGSEERLLRKADIVFTTSKELYSYCSGYNDEVYIFPSAVNFQQFERARIEDTAAPPQLKDLPKPIVGYIGGLHKWVDLDLMKKAAERYPRFSFAFVGPIQTDVSSLSGLKNVHFLGKMKHEDIPHAIKQFDVCTIPYLVTDYTKHVYPVKLNEYLALGKPVVSTALPEISDFNQANEGTVFIGRSPEEFLTQIEKALGSAGNKALIEKRLAAARTNSWDARIEKMSGLIEGIIERKSKLTPDWQAGLLNFYRGSRRKIAKVAFAFFGFYFLIFYTPLVWFLAEPLKVSDLPREADAIVVFAGGVGESGRAGQGYEERVQYAVELYKKEYAKNLIFSSGYTYIFEEPLVMRALAVSLGVPAAAIILEDNARNTYENVKLTKVILDNKGWSRVLVVSSPYHMRRTSSVFKKIAGRIDVRYTPVPDSLFYAHDTRGLFGMRIGKQITIRQIKGILHEYVGILYYWWKGNI